MKMLIVLSVLVFICGIGLGILHPNDDGSPSLGWIQSGVATSLLIVTAAYALSAQRSLHELKHARYDSLRPIIVIRYMIVERKFHTYLYNIGMGVATNITLWANNNSGVVMLGKSYEDTFRTRLSKWPDNDKAFGMPLGVHQGNSETQIEFMTGPRTPLHDEDAEYIVQYKDVFGRYYITHLIKTKQSVYGPMTMEESDKYIENRKIEKFTKEEYDKVKKRIPDNPGNMTIAITETTESE